MFSHINDLRYHEGLELENAIIQGAEERMIPVLMTALAAAIGMVPLMWAQGSGSELQKPLATVIVGGTLSATSLTLLVLPILYYLIEGRGKKRERIEEREKGEVEEREQPLPLSHT